jgi:hypothetical protein
VVPYLITDWQATLAEHGNLCLCMCKREKARIVVLILTVKIACMQIAGGTGITPMLQVASEILRNPEDMTEVSLVFGNVSSVMALVPPMLLFCCISFSTNRAGLLKIWTSAADT